MNQADLLIFARWIVPVEPAGLILEDHALAVRAGRIVGLLPATEAEQRYPAAARLERPSHLLMPGLVNAHVHAPMTLFRGMADDLPLAVWLQEHMWPAEARWVGADFVRDGVELALLEMIRSGTTCFNEMYFFPDITAEVALEHGVRAAVGMILIDQPSAWARSVEEYFEKGLAVHDRFRGSELITTSFAPHAPYTVSDESLRRIRMLSDELDAPVHMHVHETADEVESALAASGERPLTRLARLGLTGPMLSAVHMTTLEPAEISQLAERGTNVIHCPESNLKLASGFCPVTTLLDAGVNVALGTDGAASNNDLDMIGEMKTAALLAKGVAQSAAALNAFQVLQMATLNGARAIGLGDQVGSLEVGKAADLVCVDLSQPATSPVHNPVSQLVYAASRDQVSDVWVAGRQLLKDGMHTGMQSQPILARAEAWRRRMRDSND